MLSDIISSRLDFIHFASALSLFFLTAMILTQYARRKELHWLWLALFALSMAVSTGLFLSAHATVQGRLLADVGWSLHALGLFFLALYGLHGIEPGLRRGAGYVAAGALLVLPAACAQVWGTTGFVLALRLGLGPFAAIFALAGAARLPMQLQGQRFVASLRPLLMLLVFVVCMGPALLLLGGVMLGFELDQTLPGTDLHAVLLAVAGVSTAVALARSLAFGDDAKVEDRDEPPLRGMHAYAIGLTAVGFAVFMGLTITETLGNNAENTMRDELFMRVSAVGNAIDPEMVGSLRGTPADKGAPGFQQLMQQLTKIRLANPDLRFVYITQMRLPEREVILSLDTEPPTSTDYVEPGEPYPEAPDELKAIFSSGKADLVGPYEDRWGVWISGFAPVKDQYGAIMGVVGMDLRAKAFQANVAASRLVGIVITFLLALIGAGIGVIVQRNRDLALSNVRLEDEITERKAAEHDLAQSEKQYRNLVERANDGIAILREYTLLYANPRLTAMLETEGCLVGRSLDALTAPESRKDLLDYYGRRVLGKEDPGSCQAVLVTDSGREVRVEINAGVTPYRSEPAMLLIIRDVSERMKAEEDLRVSRERYRQLSITDDLTGLFNQRHFHEQLSSEMARSRRYERPLSLILLDIDDFKSYNDAYGHLAGDKVLARLGEVLMGAIRESDAPFRYGGEELAVILPETGNDEACKMAERIREQIIQATFTPVRGTTVSTTVSMGVSVLHMDETTEDFIRRVDTAMYQAKAEGKNRVVSDE